MGRESRVLPLDRQHVSEAMNTNAEILEGVRDEVLRHRSHLDAIDTDLRAVQRLRTEHDALVKCIHLEASHVYDRLEPLKRGFWGRLRWLVTGR